MGGGFSEDDLSLILQRAKWNFEKKNKNILISLLLLEFQSAKIHQYKNSQIINAKSEMPEVESFNYKFS